MPLLLVSVGVLHRNDALETKRFNVCSVFEDADIDAAVAGAVACKFRSSGQTCVCANRLYVHEAVYDEFSKKLVEAVKKFKVGNGASEGV